MLTNFSHMKNLALSPNLVLTPNGLVKPSGFSEINTDLFKKRFVPASTKWGVSVGLEPIFKIYKGSFRKIKSLFRFDCKRVRWIYPPVLEKNP